jgi:predicted DCC family thiol-disulfide oxidoreductase YuxK
VGEPSVLLFDGTCNFCNGAVQFIVDHERDDALRFAALQSAEGRTALARVAGDDLAGELAGEAEPSSMVLLEGGTFYRHSDAALRVATHLSAPWRWGRAFLLVPRPVRDAVYRWFAKNRYRWFGRTETCRVPTPELRARFLGLGPGV